MSEKPETADFLMSPNKESSRQMTDSVFSNPAEFLQYFKEQFGQFKGENSEFAGKDQFLKIKENSEDPKLRALAEIALTHFDEINQFDQVGGLDRVESNQGISRLDLDRGLKYLAGSYKPTMYWEQSKNLASSTFWMAATAAMGTLTVVAAELPLLAGGFGVATFTMGGIAAANLYHSYNYPGWMRQRAEQTNSVLKSWPEINKHLRR